jgi:hypothetical protein
MTKSELRTMIQEIVKDELAKKDSAAEETTETTEVEETAEPAEDSTNEKTEEVKESIEDPDAEELVEGREVPDEGLLAAQLISHPDFQSVCATNDVNAVLGLIDQVIKESGLDTPGSATLRVRVANKAKGDYVSGVDVMQLVYNSYLKGKDMGANIYDRRGGRQLATARY